jgi:hypothetical protein
MLLRLGGAQVAPAQGIDVDRDYSICNFPVALCLTPAPLATSSASKPSDLHLPSTSCTLLASSSPPGQCPPR